MSTPKIIYVGDSPVEKSQRTREAESMALQFRKMPSGARHKATLGYLNENFVDSREWLVAEKIFNAVYEYGDNFSFNL